MRRQFLLLLASVICTTAPLFPGDLTGNQKLENRAMLDAQKAGDQNRRREILQKLDGFLREINGVTEKENGIKLSSPIPPEQISGIEPIHHEHADKKPLAARLTAYVTGTGVRMRSSAGSGSTIVAHLDYGERIVLLAKSEVEEQLDGKSYPWILARRNDGSEGWVFGKFIGKNDPLARGSESGSAIGDGRFDLPLAGVITSTFGYRVDPVTGRKGTFHSGIDIAAPRGTAARAAADGTVAECGFYRNGYGNFVVIRHGNELFTCYGHLSAISVKTGDPVKRGDRIGTVGSTGKATGPHLHFEVRKGSGATDPGRYLRQ